MRIFFDTEFFYEPNALYPTLLSVGMVREDGETYYAILDDADPKKSKDDFIHKIIIPRLGDEKPKPRKQIANEIKEFVGKSPEFWGYFADYDWVLLSTLYGGMLDVPSDWPQFCLDIMQQMKLESTQVICVVDKKLEHNALYDAIWTKNQYLLIQEVIKMRSDIQNNIPNENVLRLKEYFKEECLKELNNKNG